MIRKITLLAVIILLGAVVRFYKLGEVPKGLALEEVRLGNSSRSIIQKPLTSAYAYIAAPVVSTIGLSPFSIRFPSALAGSLGVLAIYLVTQEITRKNPQSSAPLAASIVWAVNPWSIHVSRMASVSNVSLVLIVFSIYVLAKFTTNKKLKHIVSSIVLWCVAIATEPLSALLIAALGIAYTASTWSVLSKVVRTMIVSASMSAMIIFGIIHAKAIQSQLINTSLYEILTSYTHVLSPERLFFRDDEIQSFLNGVKELGYMYTHESILIAIGLAILIKSKNKFTGMLIMWMLAAPVGILVTTKTVIANNVVSMVAPLVIASGIGIGSIYEYLNLRNKKVKMAGLTAAVCVYIFALSAYAHSYYRHFAFKGAWDWNENITELARYLGRTKPTGVVIIEGKREYSDYIKFFSDNQGRSSQATHKIVEKIDGSTIPKNSTVAIQGWKGVPEQMKNSKEIIMTNGEIGYKVGIWQ